MSTTTPRTSSRLRRRVHRQRRPDHAHASTSCSRGTARPSTTDLVRVNAFTKTAAEGGKTVGDINNGDWISFTPYRLGNATSFNARVSSAGVGGTLQVRAGSATGTVLGSATVPVTGGWETFATVTGTITSPPTGTTTLYLTFAGRAPGRCSTWTPSPSSPARPRRRSARSRAWRQVPGRAQRRHGRRHADPDLHLQRHRRADLDGHARTIRSLGKCLDVSGGATADGTKIQLWTCNGTARAELGRPGRRDAAQPAVGQVPGRLRQQLGRQHSVHLWTCTAGANQKWTLP